MAVTADANGIYVDNGTYSFDDIYATAGIGGVDFLRVDSGTDYRTFRSLKTIFVGQTVSTGSGTTNTTTFQDTNCYVTFDNNKIFRTRTGSTSNLTTIFGTKNGTGAEATGLDGVVLSFSCSANTTTSWRGTVKLYGTTVKSRGAATLRPLQISPASAGNSSEIMNCIFDGFTGYVLGSNGSNIPTIYNLDLCVPSVSTATITAAFFDTFKRVTIGGTNSAAHLSSNTAGVGMRDVIMFGSSQPNSVFCGAANPNWKMVNVTYIDGVDKFASAGSYSPGDNDTTRADNGVHDYREYGIKVVDGNGSGISGIPVRLTDSTGSVQVSTTTDAYGQISYDSGVSADSVIVFDWYGRQSDSAVTSRDRSPFLEEVNLPSMSGYNPNYMSHRQKFRWPGSQTYTLTSGALKSVYDMIALQAVPGNPTTWVECEL
jgi:hypothetical protein